MALDLTKRVDVDAIPWDLRFGEPFGGMSVPFRAKVLCWNDPKRKATARTKFGPSSAEGIFLSYRIQPGFIWKGGYIVTFVDGLRDAMVTRETQVHLLSLTTRIVMLFRTGSTRLFRRVEPARVNPRFRVRGGWFIGRKWDRNSVFSRPH